MKTKTPFVFALVLLLGLVTVAVAGCGGSGTFRDQDGYVQNPPASPSTAALVAPSAPL